MKILRKASMILSLVFMIGFLTFGFLFSRWVHKKEISLYENNQKLQSQVELLTKENEILKAKLQE